MARRGNLPAAGSSGTLSGMDRNRDSRKNRNKGTQKPAQARPILNNASHAEKFPPVPKPERKAGESCAMTGDAIQDVFSAMSHRDSGSPTEFDAVIRFIRESENIPEDQKIIYTGAGFFGIYQETLENGRKKLQLLRKVPWEDTHKKPQWRKDMSPGISRDYTPEPKPLSELYTPEEEREFPRLGAGNVFMPRNN